MKIGCHAQTWGGVRGHPGGVGSLAHLTYLSKAPFSRAAKEIRLLGYQAMEAFDGDVLAWQADGVDVRRSGLELSGVYTAGQFVYDDAWADERAKFERVIASARDMGAGHLIIGGGSVRAQGVSPGDPGLIARRLDEVQELAAAAGIAAHFHPHPHPDGYTEEQTDEILGLCSVGLCPDLGVLAKGGVEPISFVERHIGRIGYLHLKDSLNGEDIEVGQGAVDIEGVMRVLGAAGFDGWLVAELDASEASPYASHVAILSHITDVLLPAMKGSE